MFSRSFLQISKHLPQHEKILTIILAFIVIDALFYPMTVIFEMRLYLPIFVYLVYLGFVRVKQHFKPAKFFLFAWIGLAAGVFLDEFSSLDFQPMFIGSVVEAIILAIALSFKVKELKKEKDSQKELLIHQSKLASMGEMLGNISHQWRQPLTRLSYIFMNIENLQIKEHKDFTQEGIAQLELMSQTIDDFTNFYAPSKEKEDFNLAQETRYILELINYEEIDISLEIKEECVLYNYKNEFKQVLLNLLSNAKDILSSREIQSPKIVIIIDKNSIRISDNAGGIWLEDIGKVFEPYFSTKEEGLGIGLYMSKIIIEKNMDGKLQVKNIQDGVEFKVVF
jgi:signal transduction histidine kinase